MTGREGQGRGRTLSAEHRRSISLAYGSPVERFEANVERIPFGGCWVWMASVNTQGYGQFHYKGVPTAAHRFSYRWHRHEIPAGMCILHQCDNPSCVNPDHLFLGTRADNNADRKRKGRNSPRAGVLNPMSRFKQADIKRIRNTYPLTPRGLERASTRYGVHVEVIRNILKRITYKGVE